MNSTSDTGAKAIDWQALIEQVKKVILTPKDALLAAKSQETSVKDLYLKYIMLLAAVPAVCTFLGMVIVGVQIPLLGTFRPSFTSTLVHQIVAYVVMLVGVGLFALILEKLAPKFEGSAKYIDTLKLVAFSMTPGFVAGVLYLIPWLGLLTILASLYGLYIMWIGIPIMVGVPESKRLIYFIVSIVASVIAAIILNVVIMTAAAPTLMPSFTPPAGSSQEQFDLKKFQEGLQQMQKVLPQN